VGYLFFDIKIYFLTLRSFHIIHIIQTSMAFFRPFFYVITHFYQNLNKNTWSCNFGSPVHRLLPRFDETVPLAPTVLLVLVGSARHVASSTHVVPRLIQLLCTSGTCCRWACAACCKLYSSRGSKINVNYYVLPVLVGSARHVASSIALVPRLINSYYVLPVLVGGARHVASSSTHGSNINPNYYVPVLLVLVGSTRHVASSIAHMVPD
jgi:hypothetical protein